MNLNSIIKTCKEFCSSPIVQAAAVSLISYFVFFYPGLLEDKVIFSGKDSSSFHYPSRHYLYEKISQIEFPFWTERIYGGFPIYSSIERGYLNPLNIASIIIFGPLESYQFMHVTHYLLGSLGLYLLLRKQKVNSMGFAAANFVLFFSVAQILRQQHFNAVLTTYLMPMLVLLSSSALEKRSKPLTILSGSLIAYMFYLGSFQTLLIALVAQIVYMIVFAKINRGTLIQVGLTYLLSLILVLPGLISTAQLYLDSARQAGDALFAQGSFSPLMLLNLVVPFLYKFGEGYQGVIIHRDFLMHETYVYTGLLTVVCGLLALISAADKKLKYFSYFMMMLGLVFAIVGYVPVLRGSLPLPFSLFRYWPRGLLLTYFALALLVGNFFSMKSLDLSISKLRPLILLVFFFGILELLNFKNPASLAMLRLFFRDDFSFDPSIKIWVDLVVVTGLFLTLHLIGAIKFEYLKLILFGMLMFDIFYFSNIASERLFIDSKDIAPPEARIEKSNKGRTLDVTNNLNGDNALYFKFWGLLGYDPLVPKKVDEDLRSLDLKNSRYAVLAEGTNNRIAVRRLKELGFETLITERVVVNTRSNYPLKSDSIQNKEIVREEGNLEFTLSLQEETLVETFIKNDPGFVVTANDEKIGKGAGEEITFTLPKGDYTIKIQYVPKVFFASLLASVLLLLPYFYYFRKTSFVR